MWIEAYKGEEPIKKVLIEAETVKGGSLFKTVWIEAYKGEEPILKGVNWSGNSKGEEPI